MIFGKSLKQLLRTPITTMLFIVLFAFTAFFVSSGAVLWARNQAAIKAYEDVFVTIGTVRQRATSREIVETWDALTKTYTRRSEPRYTSIIPPSVLDFDGVGYILGPERRPFYGSYRPDLILISENSKKQLPGNAVVEVTPLKDCIPDSPVEVLVERVLSEVLPNTVLPKEAGQIILLCDHNNDSPQRLYAGKTYLMYLQGGVHDMGEIMNGQVEWRPTAVTFSTQCRPDGTRMAGDMTPPAIREVTEGFYETEEGQRWLEYAHALSRYNRTLPVLPTNGTQLLLPFYNGTAYITKGEDITPEEYSSGERVCLVSENFAEMNGLSPGDMLRLPLFYADYQYAPSERYIEDDFDAWLPGMLWWYIASPLNADGGMYPVFSDHEYIIKGIYGNSIYGSDATRSMGANTIVIPAKSVHESDENNILAYGPMTDTTTTFQIPNGSIETFMARWAEQGIDDLEFTFHDRGYTQLHQGLENMKRISLMFLAIGAAMSLALVFFFSHVFISKNKMRTAIERMLGYTKRQSAASLLSGFLLAAVLAVTVGCVAGILAEGQITDKLTSQEYYDTSYTIGPLGCGRIELEKNTVSALYAPAAGLALLLVTGLISAAFVHGNVKEEPLKLLGGRKE